MTLACTSQVSKLIEQRQMCAREAEDQACSNARRLHEMRKKLRRTSRLFSGVCTRQRVISIRRVPQSREIGGESGLANGWKSVGGSEGQGDINKGASDDTRRGQDGHTHSWLSLTSTVSAVSDDNLERLVSDGSHSELEISQEQDSVNADMALRQRLDVQEPFVVVCGASEKLTIDTGSSDDNPPLSTRANSMGGEIFERCKDLNQPSTFDGRDALSSGPTAPLSCKMLAYHASIQVIL